MRLASVLSIFGTIGIIGIALFSGTAEGAIAVRSGDSVGPRDLPRITVLSSTDRGVDLVFELPVLAVDEMTMDGRRFRAAAIPGGDLDGDVGQPAIPVFTRLLAIPDRAAVTVTATPEDEEEIAGAPLAPMQADEGPTLAYDAAAYAVDAYGAKPAADAGRPGIMRDLRLVRLTFRPVRYNPARATLKVAGRVRVHVEFSGIDLDNARAPVQRPLAPSFDRIYRELVVNYVPPAGQAAIPGAYLIICPNDNQVVNILQALVQWRQRKGMPVRLATFAETGSTKESIKEYIQNAYDTWTVPPEYVCLVGDGAYANITCPTWHENLSGYYGEGDHEYTRLEGNDILSDINIGRLSVSSNNELTLVVQKITGYESAPFLDDPGWFRRACLVGDPYASGYSTVQVQQWIKHRLRTIGFVDANIDTIYGDPFVSRMTSAMNRGDTIMSYRGIQGMSGWGNSNTYALTNGWKMPFCVVITCDTGSFESTQVCRSEGFLRAGSVGAPKGGIGAIGTATIGTHTRFNNCMHYGIFYGLLYEGDYTMGSALTRGKMELYMNYQESDPNRVAIWSTWNNLMGDPALECWTGFPDPLTVTHPLDVAIGTNAVTIGVTDAGAPAADALVCLWKGTETYAVGRTDGQGEVTLPVSTPTGGDMLVTVSKHDRYTYQGTIHVSSHQRYVAYQGSTIKDDGTGSSQGNGDGIVNPGETIGLGIQLRNYGIQTATGVTATLSTDDPYVTIENAEQSFGDIPGGGSAWSTGSYAFAVSDAAPDRHPVRFGLSISSGSDVWSSVVDLPVVSADLVSDGFNLYNTGGNGRLDPGETVQISVKLRNDGEAGAITPTAQLLSASEYLDVPDGTASYETIDPGATGENVSDTFTIHAAASTYQGYVGRLKLIVDFSGGAVDTTELTVPVGQRTATDPTGPDPYGYYAFDETDTAYPEHPTYDWIELDPASGGDGTEIVLGDWGDYQDKSRAVDLPFPFRYYGIEYSKATVCSNGWVAMGSQTNAEYRNWTIPGAGGPEAMIAAFWDDLFQLSGTSKVFQKYDAAAHVWIVEWSRMRDSYNQAVETFEVILRDPQFYATDTGDGEILIQYQSVTNGDAIDGNATVGIENETQSAGLLWTFFNRYTPGSATLQPNRAIRFIPTREVLAGTIRGTVTNASNGGSPIPRATITVLENGHEVQTADDGSYVASEPPGTYTVRASHASFAADTVGGIYIQTGSTAVVNFSLRDIMPPVITHTPVATTNDTIGPYIVRATIADFSAITDAAVYYRVNGGEFVRVAMSNQGSGSFSAQIPGQPWRSMVEYYIYAKDNPANEAVSPAGAPDVCYVFYVAPTIALYTETMEYEAGWTAGGQGDDATAGIWTRCDPNGTYDDMSRPVQTEDDHTPDGVLCWVTGNAAPGLPQDYADVDNGRTTLTSPRFDLNVQGVVTLRYDRWFTNDTGNNPGEDPWIVQVSDDDGASWHDLENTTESDRSWRQMEFDLSRYVRFTDSFRIRFIARDAGGPSVVEAAVDDLTILVTGLVGADAPGGGSVPLVFGLSQNRPNPFNPRTAIRFTLDRGGPATLTVFDVAGRAIRRLVAGSTAAGEHSVVWDGRDDQGRALPSGIYLYRLDAGPRSQTRKMIMLQ